MTNKHTTVDNESSLLYLYPLPERPAPLYPLPLKESYLEFHGCVLLILGSTSTLVVKVVGGGRMNKGGLLRLALAVLTGQVHSQGEQPRAQEAGDTRGYQVDEIESWKVGRQVSGKGPPAQGLLMLPQEGVTES